MCLVRSVLGEKNGNSNNNKKNSKDKSNENWGKYKNYLEPLSEEWLEREV